MTDPSALFSLAQIAVALAGFSAIVVVFRRRESGKWPAADADRFHGMVLHSMAAAFFCVLPPAIEIFADRPETIWAVGSALLGLQIAGHVVAVWKLSSTSTGPGILVGFGLVVAVLQALNVFGLGFEREFLPYLGGVLWHVFQAGLLFVMLIWIRADDIES